MEKNKKDPFISVVMGCYNNEDTIAESIKSILNQTFSDFEFIIIDDCSKDNTVKIINSFNDSRIVLITNDVNMGLGYSLNLGLNLSRGKYVARMDADDISSYSRFQKQINYLEHHPDVICLGSGAKKIGDISWFSRIFSPNITPVCSCEEIKAWLLMGTPILHPSVMMNNQLLKKYDLNYNPKFRRAQDYEFWTRMIWKGNLINIQEKLVSYRYSSKQVSCVYAKEQIVLSKIMYQRMLSKLLGRQLSDIEIETHYLFVRKSNLNVNEYLRVKSWLNYLYPFIIKSDQFDRNCVIDSFSRRWCVVCRDYCGIFKRFFEYINMKGYWKCKYLIYLLKI